MKTLVLLSIALGSLAVACAPPTSIYITPTGGDTDNTGNGGEGGGGGSQTTEPIGGAGGDPVQVETAHSYYVKTLWPLLIETCGGCHNPDGQVGAPAFLDYDAELSYEMTRGFQGGLFIKPPTESLLTNKGLHDGPGMSTEQYDAASTWLDMEIKEGGGGTTMMTTTTTGGVTKPTLEEMLTSFAACMDYDLWLATGMDKFPLQQTNAAGACTSCHNQGTGAVWLSADPLETFEKNKMFPYIMRLITPIYEGTDPVDLAPSQRFINKGTEACANPPICHPKYNLSTENIQALESFVGTTLTKWQNGTCGTP
jgi:hypothetical protein